MGEIVWLSKEQSAVLTKKDGCTIVISPGTILTHPGRPSGIKITGFSSKESDKRGPIGLYYLPWRPLENRWAEQIWALRNPRHLIASPVGLLHFGEHIDWSKVELLEGEALLNIKMLLLEP